MPAKNNNWQVYLLVSDRGRTYVGATTDVCRRLDQHNKKKPGGARATSKESGWHLAAYISGFRNRSEAYRWEALVKKRARGFYKRRDALWKVANGMCPKPRREQGKNYIPPSNLKYHPIHLEINI